MDLRQDLIRLGHGLLERHENGPSKLVADWAEDCVRMSATAALRGIGQT